jgi:hypothetical protein
MRFSESRSLESLLGRAAPEIARRADWRSVIRFQKMHPIECLVQARAILFTALMADYAALIRPTSCASCGLRCQMGLEGPRRQQNEPLGPRYPLVS